MSWKTLDIVLVKTVLRSILQGNGFEVLEAETIDEAGAVNVHGAASA